MHQGSSGGQRGGAVTGCLNGWCDWLLVMAELLAGDSVVPQLPRGLVLPPVGRVGSGLVCGLCLVESNGGVGGQLAQPRRGDVLYV